MIDIHYYNFKQNPFLWIKECFDILKARWQRAHRGYADRDLCDLNYYLLNVCGNALIDFYTITPREIPEKSRQAGFEVASTIVNNKHRLIDPEHQNVLEHILAWTADNFYDLWW